MPEQSPRPIRKLLAANRSEIAIRVFRSAHELGIRTVAVYSHEDRFALHRFKADEAYRVGKPGEPIRAYLDIPGITFVGPNPDILDRLGDKVAARELAKKANVPVLSGGDAPVVSAEDAKKL